MIFLFCYYIPRHKLSRSQQRRNSQLSSNNKSFKLRCSITNPSGDDISIADDIIDDTCPSPSLTSNASLTRNELRRKNSSITSNKNVATSVTVDTDTSIVNEDTSISIQITKWTDSEKQQLQNFNSCSSENNAGNDQPPNPLQNQKSLLRIPSLVLEEIADDVSGSKTQTNGDKDINEAIYDLGKKGTNHSFHHRTS